MSRGIRFINPNKYGKFIYEILKPIDFTKYTWYIGFHEIYKITDNNFSGESLFSDEVIDGQNLVEIIQNNTYYMIFLELTAFPKSEEFSEISTYQDFLTSNAELMLLVTDCSYTDIYCKDGNLIEELFSNAMNNQYSDIEYINKTDGRTRMSVW